MTTPSRRWQFIGLAALALVTALLVVWSLAEARSVTPAGTSPATTPIPTATQPPTTPATASPTPSTSTTPIKGLKGLAQRLDSADPVSLMVLGDGSGDGQQEWVSLWAVDHLAGSRRVAYHAWSASTQRWATAKNTGKGAATTIWNASVSAPSLKDEPKRVVTVWKPVDAVILSYGHRKPAAEVAQGLDAIYRAVRAKDKDAAVIVMLQNPDPVATQTTQQQTVEAVKRWAQDAGLDTVNIYDAFVNDPAPRYQLVQTDGSPTPVGSQLWAKTFDAALRQAAG